MLLELQFVAIERIFGHGYVVFPSVVEMYKKTLCFSDLFVQKTT